MGESVTVPRDIAEMALLVMADRKMQGWTPDDIEEMRDDFRLMAQDSLDDFRAYLQSQVKPIRERRQMVLDTVMRIKARIEREAREAERRAA